MFNAKITIKIVYRAILINFHLILCFSYVNKNVKENYVANKTSTGNKANGFFSVNGI